MKEELITYEVSKLAREKGFDEKCEYQYINLEKGHKWNGKLKDFSHAYSTCPPKERNSSFEQGGYCTAPTQALLQKWLREVHNIDVFVLRENPLVQNKKSYWVGIDTDKEHYMLTNERLVGISENNGLIYQNNMDTNVKLFDKYEDGLEVILSKALKLI